MTLSTISRSELLRSQRETFSPSSSRSRALVAENTFTPVNIDAPPLESGWLSAAVKGCQKLSVLAQKALAASGLSRWCTVNRFEVEAPAWAMSCMARLAARETRDGRGREDQKGSGDQLHQR